MTITFRGDVCHQPSDLQSRRIIDEEKTNLYTTFQKNLKLKLSNIFKDKLGKMHGNQCTHFNRIGPGTNVCTFQDNASRARKKIASMKNINEVVFKLQNKYKKLDKKIQL